MVAAPANGPRISRPPVAATDDSFSRNFHGKAPPDWTAEGGSAASACYPNNTHYWPAATPEWDVDDP